MQFPLKAQIINDSTLPVNSQVDLKGNIFTIEGGTGNDSNLFHSFSEFSLPTNFQAFFNNSQAIQNIFVRVTGNDFSNIDGQIRANGSASLFLLNPNGLSFGPNSSINLGGSFIGTTANSVFFANGDEFSATDPLITPTLAVNIPIGLKFRQNQGAIRVQNTGHQLFRVGETPFEFILSPILGRELTPGLQVQGGNTLALIGGSVELDGGILKSEEGKIEIGSVYSGVVNLLPTSLDLNSDYTQVNRFGDIQLDRQSLVDVSGDRSGSIQIEGAKIYLKGGSTIFSQNEGILSGENIEIKASEFLKITGTSSEGIISSQITSVAQGSGNGGDINIVTPNLFALDGGRIGTLISQEGSGRAGNINVKAIESIELVGDSGLPALRASQIITETNSFAFGQTGDITLSTGRLILRDGANIIGGINIGNGSTELIRINSTESILVEGANSTSSVPSIIGLISLAGTGDIGSLIIDTPSLFVRDGGNINTSVLGQGNAGEIEINASDLVEITGSGSLLISAAQETPPEIVQAIGLPEEPSGISGNLIINSPRLVVAEEGQVTVRNDGTGNAGDLLINSDTIFLSNKAGITASTASGKGGNINLNVSNILQLRDNSLISATAGGTGQGGNIEINNEPFILAFPGENSDIIANASEGRGGEININAQGLFGIEQRKALQGNRTNDIDASSEFGLTGVVEINQPDLDPNRGLIELPETVVDPNALVAQNPCKRGSESEFVISGRGGLPPRISEDSSSDATQVDLVEPAPIIKEEQKNIETEEEISSAPSELNRVIPAQGWVFNEKGEVVLVAYDPTSTEVQRLKDNPTRCSAPY